MARARENGMQSFVKTQFAEARIRLDGLEKSARLNATDVVKDLGKRANEASGEALKLINELQTRVIRAIGVASQSQVREISRELGKLSKKIDALAGKKPGKTKAQA